MFTNEREIHIPTDEEEVEIQRQITLTETLTLPNGRMRIGSRLDLRWNLTPSLWSGPGAHAASRKHRLKNSYP